ncbi:MAG: dicarboxylate/amino acid:cation symporter [Myxococcales bacterium]|nr:dicarboxylate/amino acid:cation symporter [Myxococcales bacterium]
MKLHTKILLGLLAGAAAGIAVNLTLGGDHPGVVAFNRYVASPVGQIFLRLLFMVVMPLVFASIALGVAGIGDIRKVGRIGGKTIGYFLITTVLSVTLGLAVCATIRPGSRVDASTRDGLLASYADEASSKIETSQQNEFGIETFVNIVTRNPIKSAVDGDMLGVIFFGLMFGAGITLIHEKRGKFLVEWLEGISEVVIKIVEMAMKLAPFGVAGLIFGVTSRFGFALFAPLAIYVAVVLGALLLHATVTMSLIVRFVIGMSPVLFFSRIREALITAFSTSSSGATLPTNIAVGEQNLGLPPKVAGFVYPLGATMCMHGTALFEGTTVIFLCEVFGKPLSLGQMAVVMVMCVITAVGAAGVPGGSIPLLVGVLAMFGVPAAGIAVILGVDRVLDMARTTVNVLGDHTAAAFIAKSEGLWTAADVPATFGMDRAGADDSPGWPADESTGGEKK